MWGCMAGCGLKVSDAALKWGLQMAVRRATGFRGAIIRYIAITLGTAGGCCSGTAGAN
ncbi:hypothetical protein HBH98_121440 [Parastagonospora nodorum]|nr:hypothetical protein HBH53_199230 [Parastagonospora nodorum]KAH4049978.1 hypothetical protein HBH49_140440 [Parastagonospora nodorum]KAH4091671.1 hypothetical protein HBH46_185610 [Parastagonospora nodorum]KAH4098355.1 hypothetical protein HBH48_032470 [Parastagonospora nodorum]KAH4129333.1 hypothetical protein HBH45_208010 [Parastagonospora nodorum]